MFLNTIAVFLGGGLGAVLRYFTSLLYLRIFDGNFPLATLSVNLVGSLLMGLLGAFLQGNEDISEHMKYALTVGLCGGFTTFSTFAFEIVEILCRGEIFIAIYYMILSIFLCVLIAAAGFYWAKNYVYY